jgi:hypothetical protein
VAAFGMALLADEEMMGKVAKESNPYGNVLNLGYSRNEYGQVTFNANNNE